MIAGFRLGFGAICLLLFTTNSAEIKTASVLPGLAKVYHRRVPGWPSEVLERLHRETTFLRFVFGSFFPQLRVFNNFSASFSGSFLATHVAFPFVFSNFSGSFLKKVFFFVFSLRKSAKEIRFPTQPSTIEHRCFCCSRTLRHATTSRSETLKHKNRRPQEPALRSPPAFAR